MASMRDIVPSNRPNWTYGQPPAPPGPGADIVPSNRPNWRYAAPQQPVDFDMGPGNPRVGPNGSPEAQAFKGAAPAPASVGPAPPTPAAPTESAATGWRGAWRSLRSGANSAGDAAAAGSKSAGGSLMRGGLAVAPALAGFGVASLQQRMDADAPKPEPFVPPASAPGQIPTDPSMRAPALVERHPLGFGPDNEFTRNLANTANAMTGLGPGVGAGMGAVSNFVRSGSNAMRAAVGGERTAQTAIPFVQGAQAAGATSAVAQQPSLTSSGPTAPEAPTSAPAPANPNGVITRDGNSYSGGDIKFGADIRNPDGSARNLVSDAPGKGFGVTSLGTSEGRRQDAMELQRLRTITPSVTTGDGGSTLGQGPVGMGGGGSLGAGGTAGFGPSLSTLSNSSMKPRDIRHAQDVAVQRDNNRANIEASARTASMREGGDMARANLSADVQRENNAQTNTTAQRGQDMTYGGHMLSVQQAQAAAQRAQTNTDREYMRATGNDDFSRQSTAQADHDKWANTTFTTEVDGKTVPDVQKIGDFNNTAQATVGALVAQLRQSGDPASIAKANKLAGQGLAGLDAEDRALMKQLYDRRERHVQTRGAGPGSGSGPVSNNLFDYALTGRTKGLVQNTVQMRGGQSIPENDLRYTQPANRLLPDWFKTPTTALGPTPQEARRMRTGSN